MSQDNAKKVKFELQDVPEPNLYRNMFSYMELPRVLFDGQAVAMHPAEDTPDDLAARVFREECIAYPEAIRLFAEGRLRLEGKVVHVDDPGYRRE